MEDLDMYLPKLNPNGFIVLDDVSWDSVKPPFDRLNGRMKLLWKKVDNNGMNDFAVFWDESSFVRVFMTKLKIRIRI
jgi:hypothetical protein